MTLATSNPHLSTQLASAIPLALAASVYPPAIAVLIYYLGRESPRRLVLAYFGGAFAMTLAVGIAGIAILIGSDVNPRDRPTPSAGLDLVLGATMLAAAFLLARRRSVLTTEKPPRERRVGARGAVLLGIAMYTPSLFYLSAMKLVADADPSAGATVLSALLLTLCVLLFLEVPIGLYLRFPDATHTKLSAFNAWLRGNGRTLLMWGFLIGGFYMLGRGIARLIAS
jgi:hypothetical protein